MPSPSPPPRERATVVFGAIASVRAEGCPRGRAAGAVSAAFRSLRRVHRLMSFHEPASELSRLNREACRRETPVSPETLDVLVEAKRLARASQGAFDPTIAPLAVAAGDLPWPDGAPEPDPAANWSDVWLDERRGMVRFARPLWLDLGGIAKGYAVDLAVAQLRRRGVRRGAVNAGGDLRLFGRRVELVALDCGEPGLARAVRLRNGSLAASGAVGAARGLPRPASHFDGRRRRASPPAFAAVTAPNCVHADALTKVLLAPGERRGAILRRFSARGLLCTAEAGWSMLGGADG